MCPGEQSALPVRILAAAPYFIYMPLRLLAIAVAAIVCFSSSPSARAEGADAAYVGGTASGLDGKSGQILTGDDLFLEFRAKGTQVHVQYDKINLLEYGLNVDRRLVMAAVISPIFLLSKKRQHFLTVGFNDQNGKQQALVFKVGKKDIRAILVALEARTGLKIQFQDDEARKAGKG
jgi:hypothetical protein